MTPALEPVVDQVMMDRAAQLISDAEAELGELTPGQRRDLLMDNTTWNSAVVRRIVHMLLGKIPAKGVMPNTRS